MISHPMRRDSAGAVVTVDDYSARAAAELAGHVVSTQRGESPLAPLYGIDDPAQGQVSAEAIAAAIAVCEPEVTAVSVTVAPVAGGRVSVRAEVEWSDA